MRSFSLKLHQLTEASVIDVLEQIGLRISEHAHFAEWQIDAAPVAQVFVYVANDVSELQRHSKATCLFLTFFIPITEDLDADQTDRTRNTKTVTSERLELLETYRFKISLNAKQNLFE